MNNNNNNSDNNNNDIINCESNIDYRKIGNNLELFIFSEYSPGSCFWLPNGTIIYNRLQEFMKLEQKIRGFKEIRSPIIAKSDLWKISGHWDKYKENMFVFDCNGDKDDKDDKDDNDTSDNNDNNATDQEADKYKYALSAMNCPKHCIMFKHMNVTYKDLPLRLADMGCLHRNELKGTLTGLTRVRQFCQDDAHIFCSNNQIEEEILNCMDFLDYVYNIFGLKYEIGLSTRPVESIGTDEIWNNAETALKSALTKYKYSINDKDGAFYGPKIDIKLTDSYGRKHQCGTIQLDFNLPERFDLSFVNKDEKLLQPIMIHRAIYGSFERFIAIILEHYQGKLPLWLSPRQIIIIPVTKYQTEYVLKLKKQFEENNIVCDIDVSGKTLSKKIFNAQTKQYNYALVIGKNEVENNMVNVRTRDSNDTKLLPFNYFLQSVNDEIKNKK